MFHSASLYPRKIQVFRHFPPLRSWPDICYLQGSSEAAERTVARREARRAKPMNSADEAPNTRSNAVGEAKGLTLSGRSSSGRAKIAADAASHPETRQADRRHQAKTCDVERRRSSRRYSDRLAASFTSAFVAQWLGQQVAESEPGSEIALHRSAKLVYAAVQEREAQYYRSLGQHAKKAQDYS
jgi:hypothetical protein